MNNHTERISRYLQNEMPADERAAFEAALANDEALKNELQVQQQVLEAVTHAGIKAEFAKAIRHKAVVRKLLRWGSLAAACVAFILLFTFRANIFPGMNNISGSTSIADVGRMFISPPLARINVPLREYNFDAEKGDTIFYPSGSVIYFPPSALVDEAGIPVKGKVTVTYREFSDPLDFYVSGIPMSYDSAGKKYLFESAAMCEINAYKENKHIFVNPRAKPEINLSCTNKDPKQNLYFLDTVNRNWKYIGKDMISEIKRPATTTAVPRARLSFESDSLFAKPLKPIKADDDKQSFSIEIEPGSFEELQSYNGLKFEVADESNYKRSDAEEHWDDVKLKHSSTDGLYEVTFTRPGRMVTYKVRPVLEGSDYDAAMKVFDEKNKAYEQALKNRLASEKIVGDSIVRANRDQDEKIKAGLEQNEKLYNLIEARNKKGRELLALTKKKSKDPAEVTAMEKEFMQLEDQRRFLEMTQDEKDQMKNAEILRSFPINSFGYWNCDQPVLQQGAIIITAAFKDSLNNDINFLNLGVVYKGLNTINQPGKYKKIAVVPERENMLWGIVNGSFYYFTYDDFSRSGINSDTRSFTFKMRRSEKDIASYNEIREFVGKF